MPDPAYLTWSNKKEFADVAASMVKTVDSYDCVYKSKANFFGNRTFTDFDSNISVRSEYNRADYEYFRRSEQRPSTEEESIRLAMKAYENIAVIRTVIDMMADFTIQGIRIYHRDPKVQNFLDEWSNFIDFKGVSERIANMLYRTANCPIKMTYGRVPVYFENEWKKASANFNDEVTLERREVVKKTIPLRYNILNPLSLKVIGGDIAAFVGKPVYGLKINNKLASMIKTLNKATTTDQRSQELMQYVPQEMKTSILGGTTIIPLDQDKLKVLFYKKDDWNTWACPFLCALFEPLFMLEKMHLADISALDGAISQIRLWNLGDLEHKIVPTSAGIRKLQNILANVGNGTLDLVWGPELKFTESNSQVHNYLKSEKYQQVMSEIYAGLGVPPSLTAAGGTGQTGFTNNYISMKTLVERLNYGRNVIERFWEDQLKILQKAFGWRFPASIDFDFKVLGDDSSEKALLIDMYDRNLIPAETMQQIFGRDPKIEKIKGDKEERMRKSGKLPPKAGPFHNAMIEEDMKKIILQSGGVAPSEVGVELLPKKEGEKPIAEITEKFKAEFKPKPTQGGRTLNSKDTKQRKKKAVKPRSSVASVGSFIGIYNWANEAQAKINELLTPAILERTGKGNLRQLTNKEVDVFEDMKMRILYNLDPYCEINLENVYNILTANVSVSSDFVVNCKTLAATFEQKNNKKPTLKEMREIQSSAYALENEVDNECN
jgi:hypothetical protein